MESATTSTLMTDIIPFVGARKLEAHPEFLEAFKAPSGQSEKVRDVVLRAVVTAAAEASVAFSNLPRHFEWLHCQPISVIKWEDILNSDAFDIANRMRSAVYEKGAALEHVLTPLERHRMDALDPAGIDNDSCHPNGAKFIELIRVALARINKLEGADNFLEGGSPEKPAVLKLAGDFKRDQIRLNLAPVPPPIDPTSKGGAFVLQRQMAAHPFVPQLPGTGDPSLLAHHGQSPIQKLHSHMVAETAAELRDLKNDMLRQSAEAWAVEQYPFGDPDDFDKQVKAKAHYDSHISTLRELLVVDQVYGDDFPEEARARLAALRDRLEQRAVTELAFGQSAEAGKMAKLVIGKSSSSFLGRYSDEIASFMSASAEAKGAAKQAKTLRQEFKGSLGKVTAKMDSEFKRFERQAKRAKSERAVREHDKANSSADKQPPPPSKAQAAEGEYTECELCGNTHKGGKANCVFNPDSSNYNSNFGKFQRERLTQQSRAPHASGVFRRIGAGSSSSRGFGAGKVAGNKGAPFQRS